MVAKTEELINARIRNFPYHRKVTTKTTNGQKTTTQTYVQSNDLKVSQAEFDAYEHLLETEEQYQARQSKTTTKKSGDK